MLQKTVELHLLDAVFILHLHSTSRRKSERNRKKKRMITMIMHKKPNASELNNTMDLSEQHNSRSHTVFDQLSLESQVQILLRPQMFMSVFQHFQSVYSSSQLLWFISLTWARFMYGQNKVRILKFNSHDYRNLFKLMLNVFSFYIFLKTALLLLWTRQHAYSKWSPYSPFQTTDLSKHKITNTLFIHFVPHLIYDE